MGRCRTYNLILCLLLLLLPATITYAQTERSTIRSYYDTAAIMDEVKQAGMLNNKQDTAAAKSILYRALGKSRIIRFGRGERNALLALVQIHYRAGDYTRTQQLATLLLKASHPAENKDAVLYAYYFQALACQRSSNYDEAFKAYTKALEYVQNNLPVKAELLNNMSVILFTLNQYPLSAQYADQCIAVRKTTKDNKGLIAAYTNRARIPAMLKDYHNAEKYLDSALSLAQQYQLREELPNIYIRKAESYNQSGLPELALTTLQIAQQLHRDNPDLGALNHLANIFEGDAYLLQKNYSRAENAYLEALEKIDTLNKTDLLYTTHKLSNLYESTQQYKEAYYAHLASHNIVDDIRSNERLLRIRELEAQYNTSQKDKALALQHLKLVQSQKSLAQKNLVIVSVSACALILLLVSLGTYRAYQRRKNSMHEKMKTEVLKGIMKGEEKERIRLSRELHDGIGGMIAAIKMNLATIDAERLPPDINIQLSGINAMLEDTNAEIRTSAHNLMPDILNRYNLNEALVQFITKLNKRSPVAIRLHTPYPLTALNKVAELLLYRILQEAIQNALKHAEASIIDVQLLEYNGYLTLTVEDNGKGMPTETSTAGGIGLNNISWRVKSLRGILEVESRSGAYTIVRIVLELEKLQFLYET